MTSEDRVLLAAVAIAGAVVVALIAWQQVIEDRRRVGRR